MLQLLLSSVASSAIQEGPPPAISGTNWRIAVVETHFSEFGSPGNCALAEVEMRESIGGADTCTGGTASAASGVASRAFDNNGSTIWNPSGSAPFILQYAHSVERTITEIAITTRSDNYQSDNPIEFVLQTNDGSVVDVATFKTGPWGPGETRVFPVSGYVEEPREFIRLQPTGCHGGAGARFSLSGVEFRTTSGGANIATGGHPFCYGWQLSSTNSPDKAFDGVASTRFAAINTGNFDRAYIGYHLTSPIADQVMEVAFTCTDETYGPAEAPTGFHVQYGSGHVWTTLWTVTDIPAWTRGETRIFTKP